MLMSSEVRHEHTSDALPPRELWVYNPEKDGQLEVIYDQYGLVDMEATVKLLDSTIEPGFDFASDYADDHHAQHDYRDYQSQPEGWVNPRQFRNLRSRQMRTGRMRHAWWHKTIMKPAIPKRDVMKHCIDAEVPIVNMQNSMKYAREVAHQNAGPNWRQEHFRQLQMRMGYFIFLLDQLKDVPKEFQLVSVDDLEVNNVNDMTRIARELAKYTMPKVLSPIVLKENARGANPRRRAPV